MTLDDIYALLLQAGYPVAYSHFNGRQSPPFICYAETGSNNFYADDTVYKPIKEIRVELYTAKKDPQAEKKVEDALDGLCWEKSETWIDTESVYEIIYEIEIESEV